MEKKYLINNKELMKEWNYEKNDELKIYPNEYTEGSNKKVWWKCNKGHEWDAVIYSRASGIGCPYCSNKRVKKGYNDLGTTHPELLNEWNYEKNNKFGIYPFEFSYGSTKKVWWKCKEGHEYETSIVLKISKNVKCPICNNQQLLKGYNDFQTKHPILMKEWNYEKNDRLGIKPDEIIKGGKTKLWWKCDRGHEWQSSIPNRIRNNKLYNRCPICSSYLRTSIPEKIIFYYLQKIFPNTKLNYKTEWLRPKELDIFIPEINTAIEYDGVYFHKQNKISSDLEKDNLCKKNNVNLIRIKEKNSKITDSLAIVYNLKQVENARYTHIEEALRFLERYLKVNINVDIKRDFNEIIKTVIFLEKEQCIAKTNPEVLEEWNYKKNQLLGITPENMSKGSSFKIWWKCKNGHDYEAIISTKINQNTGCPYCSNKKILKGFNDIETTHPELLKEWNYNKNNESGITPNNISKGSSKEVWWKCSKGHDYKSIIIYKLKGINCPYCSGHKLLKGFNDIESSYPDLLKEWDYDKNNKLNIFPDLLKKGSNKKAWWKCPKGHNYFSSINNRITHNTKCPYCSGKKILKGYNDIATTHPELLNEWDYEKNNELNITPFEVGKGSKKDVYWICSNNHSYLAKVYNKANGRKCPYCSGAKVLEGYNDMASTHPELLEMWNYEKNNEIGIYPNTISKSYSKKVWWKCINGHDYQRYVYNQRKGAGKCPICKK